MRSIKFITAAAVLLGALSTLSACAGGPTSRADVCQDYDSLGIAYDSADGIFDNAVFDRAGDLADVAGRYSGSPSLGDDSAALNAIAGSDNTNGFALAGATGAIAELCGHELGVGVTQYDDDPAAGGYNAPAVAPSTPDYAEGNSSGDSTVGGGNTDPDNATQNDPTDDERSAGQPSVTDESSALAALQQEVNSDRDAVEQLVGEWVPQLSSKSDGLVADGMTYDYEAIWQDFQSKRQTDPEALLLWSGDYSSFSLRNFWVTVAPVPSGTPVAANSWCDDQGLGINDCFAKLISHIAGPSGSTKPR
ncbi:MAG TPA: hypothetical protein VHW44_18170 [Pseudonocardiaceae bacterium]|jgi:serine/threonine-protein kinase|nr:hypothetical protein [Pseudonocardiaceae bacterium]